MANITRASRKDVRDAVQAARKAFPGWAAATAYNRGQILYRAAEGLESRGEELIGRSGAERDVLDVPAAEVVSIPERRVHGTMMHWRKV